MKAEVLMTGRPLSMLTVKGAAPAVKLRYRASLMRVAMSWRTEARLSVLELKETARSPAETWAVEMAPSTNWKV